MSVFNEKIKELYKDTREVYRNIIRNIIEKWDTIKSRKQTTNLRHEDSCCLLSRDEQVFKVYNIVNNTENSIKIIDIFNRFIDIEPFLSELWKNVSNEISQQFGEEAQRQLVRLVSRQLTFLLALSPVSESDKLRTSVIYEIKVPDALNISLTFFDLAESLILQYILIRSAAALIYLYGSSRFRREAFLVYEKMKEKDLDYKDIHDIITHKIAPPIYSFLSALNLVSGNIDEEIRRYKIIRYLSVNQGTIIRNIKAVIPTGMGAALAKALIYGIAARSTYYIPSFYVTAVVGNRLLIEIWHYIKTTDDIKSIFQEALARHRRIMRQTRDIISKAPKEFLKDIEIFYDSADVIRDSVLSYIIQKTAEGVMDAQALSELLRIL